MLFGVQIAQIPTAIHKWNLPGVAGGFEVSIKRDDITGAALSGNKVNRAADSMRSQDQYCTCSQLMCYMYYVHVDHLCWQHFTRFI